VPLLKTNKNNLKKLKIRLLELLPLNSGLALYKSFYLDFSKVKILLKLLLYKVYYYLAKIMFLK
jgi:hypothetical protein